MYGITRLWLGRDVLICAVKYTTVDVKCKTERQSMQHHFKARNKCVKLPSSDNKKKRKVKIRIDNCNIKTTKFK